MAIQNFKVVKRSVTGRKVKSLRQKGISPANIFGNKIPSINISIETKPFLKLFLETGESTLINLDIEGEKTSRPVFVRAVTKHPVTGSLLHVVFNQVNLKEKVTAPVPVKLVGEAPAEKEKIGILVQQLDELEVKALPTDMPESIEVNVSSLSLAGTNIKVSDLKLDSKLEIETDSDTIIVQIEALAKEEVVEPPAAAVSAEPVVTPGEEPAASDASVKPEQKGTSK